MTSCENPLCECERCKERNIKYRNYLIGNPRGRELLGLLLEDLGFFRVETSEADRVLNNFGRVLLWKTGLYQDLTSEKFVNALVRPLGRTSKVSV
jgi:hypothetical protein